jgi:prepilin-type processing-associated H-X9-DG protein
LIIVGGLLMVYIQKARLAANLLASQNNLRQLALFAAHNSNPNIGLGGAKFPDEIPPATVVLPGVAPDDRLSWVVPVLPGIDQKKNPAQGLIELIDITKPWSEERNQKAARIRLSVTLSPENTPQVPPDSPAITCYVGITGVGVDSGALMIPPLGPTPPRAGAFRYDAPTPFGKIEDGLSQTLLLAETADDPGPWLRGGHATARGLDDAANAKPLIGWGGQFGGFFPQGANIALCDGSVRIFTAETSPSVLLKMATIAGGDNERNPD